MRLFTILLTAVLLLSACGMVGQPLDTPALTATPFPATPAAPGTAGYPTKVGNNGSGSPQTGHPTPGSARAEADSILTWQGPDGSQLKVTKAGSQYAEPGSKGGPLTTIPFTNPTFGPLIETWRHTYTAFTAQTSAGAITFNGSGPAQPTPAEQRMLAEWSQLRFNEALGGRSGAAWGMALNYNRHGGLAGFCDQVVVYRDGSAIVETCKTLHASFRLTASHLALLYDWLDTLPRTDYEDADPAQASDAMSITLTIEGKGGKKPGEDTLRAIVEFCAALEAQAAFTASAPADLAAAETALRSFFTALNQGDFRAAAGLYGGDTSQLQAWNPCVLNDPPQWLERSCAQNRLACLLPRSITYRGPDARQGYQFYLEFNNPDGTLYRQGNPASGPLQTQFLVTVAKTGESWQVLDLITTGQ